MRHTIPPNKIRGASLAETAQQIAQSRKISFAEALPIARRQISMAAPDDPSIQINTSVTAPSAGRVRQAVVNALGFPTTFHLLRYAHVLGGAAIEGAATAVREEWKKLGLSDSVAAPLRAQLATVLRKLFPANATNESGKGDTEVMAIIEKAAEHMEEVYTGTSKAATQGLSESRRSVTIWSGRSSTPVLPVDRFSFHLANTAERIQRERRVSFGEALTAARHQVCMAADVVTPEAVHIQVAAELQEAFRKILGGADEKIIDSGDLFQIKNEVAEGLGELGLDQTTSDNLLDELQGFLDSLLRSDDLRSSLKSSDASRIMADAADRVEAAYRKQLAALRR